MFYPWTVIPINQDAVFHFLCIFTFFYLPWTLEWKSWDLMSIHSSGDKTIAFSTMCPLCNTCCTHQCKLSKLLVLLWHVCWCIHFHLSYCPVCFCINHLIMEVKFFLTKLYMKRYNIWFTLSSSRVSQRVASFLCFVSSFLELRSKNEQFQTENGWRCKILPVVFSSLPFLHFKE